MTILGVIPIVIPSGGHGHLDNKDLLAVYIVMNIVSVAIVLYGVITSIKKKHSMLYTERLSCSEAFGIGSMSFLVVNALGGMIFLVNLIRGLL